MKTGRPKLPSYKAKGVTLSIRMQHSERELVEKAASKSGIKTSEWARKMLINAATTIML